MNLSHIIKPSVLALETYAVKGKAPQPGLIKLNQNENPFDVPEDLKRELIDEFFTLSWNRYPDVFPTVLLKALSKYTNHPEDGIIAGNGSNELMYTILMASVSKGSKVLIPSPSFFLYEKAAKVFDGIVVTVMMNEDLSFATERILQTARDEQPAVIVLVSPNSPTGQSISIGDVERILSQTSALVIVDEAYIEFSEKESAQSLIEKYDRLVILRTFSKAFSMAGLRVGYLLAQPLLCAELLKAKIPFTVNFLSAAVAMKLMERNRIVIERIAFIKSQRDFLLRSLQAINGIEVFPSDTNFLVFRTFHEAKSLFDALLARNVLVRDVSSYPMLERTLRVNAGTENENKTFLSTLQQCL